MSDDEANYTYPYDYGGYNHLDVHDFAPCDNNDVGDFGRVFLPTIYSLVFILGFIGNGLVVCVLVKHRNKASLTDICLFNLALSDLLFVLTLPFFSHFTVVGEWTFGDFMCHFLSGLHSIGFFSSTFFMVVLTLERYWVITHPHRVSKYRTLRTAVAMTLFVWMLSLGVSLPSFIFSKSTNDSGVLGCFFVPDSDAWVLYNLCATNILGLLIPLLVMVVCYSRIIPTLVKIRGTKKHRIVKLIIAIVVVFFLFWTPFNICYFLQFLASTGAWLIDCEQEAHLWLSLTVTETVAYTHCCLNPIIYAFVGQKFLKQTLQMLRQWAREIPFASSKDLSDSSYKKSSVVSRSSEVTATFIK